MQLSATCSRRCMQRTHQHRVTPRYLQNISNRDLTTVWILGVITSHWMDVYNTACEASSNLAAYADESVIPETHEKS